MPFAQGRGREDPTPLKRKERSPEKEVYPEQKTRCNTIFGGMDMRTNGAELKRMGDESFEGSGARKNPFSEDVIYGPTDFLPPTMKNDGLVVDVMIGTALVRRAMVDTGSTVNIMYYGAFRALQLKEEDLTPDCTPLYGFVGQVVWPLGTINLPVCLGTRDRFRVFNTDFLVLRETSSYNLILGRPLIMGLNAVISLCHGSIKFPTSMGVAELRGDEEVARVCYIGAAKEREQAALVTAGELAPEVEEELYSGEATESFPLAAEYPERVIKIGAWLPEAMKASLKSLLREFAIMFAWSADDMPAIPAKLSMHHLDIDPSVKPIKQKKWHLGEDRREAVRIEVKKLLTARIIREVVYPTWLANPVLVKKHDASWRMCVDFTDLNKACPKDCYPLPKIDQLVLRKSSVSKPTEAGKLEPNWEGPYRVARSHPIGAYQLSDLSGKMIPRTWHVSNLRKYYEG